MYRYLYPSSWKRIISSLYSPSSSEQTCTSPCAAEDGGQNVDLLPPEIIYNEIVPRLPFKSLCRFKCVSKPWRSLISHILIKRRRLLVAVLGFNGSPNRLCSLDVEPFFNYIENGHNVDGLVVAPTDLDFVNSGVHGWRPWIYYSGYGLFLTMAPSNGDPNVSLNNPVTKESKILPKLSIWRRGESACIWKNMYGVGFDYSTYDYKVINLQDYSDGIMFSVYTLRTDSWRKIDHVYPYSISLTEGIVVNGAVHWLAKKFPEGSWVIMSFLLAEEEVRDIALPLGVIGPEVELSGAFRNWLCITGLKQDSKFNEFWVMKEYGVRGSWTKMQVSIPYQELQHSGFWTESLDLMVFDRTSLVMYNFNDDTFWNLSVGGDIVKDGFFRTVGFYSLLP